MLSICKQLNIYKNDVLKIIDNHTKCFMKPEGM